MKAVRRGVVGVGLGKKDPQVLGGLETAAPWWLAEVRWCEVAAMGSLA